MERFTNLRVILAPYATRAARRHSRDAINTSRRPLDGPGCGKFFRNFLPPAGATENNTRHPLRRGHANLLCIVPILVYVPPKRVQS